MAARMPTTSRKTEASSRWANDEFASARLGNKLRTERLVAISASALRNPAGLVTEVFPDAGPREGAYKFLENEAVSIGEITAAACRAAGSRAAGMPYVFVPVDGSSLSLREYEGEAERGVGTVGAHNKGGAGVLVMNAVAIDPLGSPLGMFDQQWWTRRGKSSTVDSRHRKLEDKETKHWLAAIDTGARQWAKTNPATRLWFQLDRGGDFHQVLTWAHASPHWITVRAAYDRRTNDEETKYLWATLEAAPLAGKKWVELPATKKRKARVAVLELRYAPVSLRLRDRRTNKVSTANLWALLAREAGTPADGSDRLEWILLTNHEIRSKADAERVLFGYTQRWRIEQFHRVWKSVCKVEQTQLRDIVHIERWAVILASVAMRLLRLTYLARNAPDTNAGVELSRVEIAALILHKGKRTHKLGDEISIGLATRWIAEWGGYVGERASGGPPGTTVLARGLRRLEYAAETVAQVLEFAE